MTDTSEIVGTPAGASTPAGAAPEGPPAGGSTGEPPAARAATTRRRQRRRVVFVFVVLAAAVTYLLVEGLGSSLDYFDTVSQALSRKVAIGTGTIRLEGLVVRGTVQRTVDGADFEVSGGGHRVVVHNTGTPPQLFQPDIPVVVVGHFASTGSTVFLSNEIMVKHTANYIAQHPNRVRAPDGKVH